MSLVAVLQSATAATPVRAEVPTPPLPRISQDSQVVSQYSEAESKFTPDDVSRMSRTVPFYSQFTDISDPNWKKIGCGIASLAMIIDYYGDSIAVDTLLQEGIAADAYLENVGWTYAGLIGVSHKYGLDGVSYDLAGESMESAFAAFKNAVAEGPVIASVYYTFTPGHPIPHLVVVNDINDNTVHYNDPAEPNGSGTISISNFQAAWKKRYIAFWPA